ncbi:exo-alpha-sialidase [soil metagenome]
MKQKIITCGTWITFMMMASISNAQKITQAISANQIQLTSSAPVIPVLERASSNPLLRIRIYVPELSGEKKYQKINCTLNKIAVSDIEELQVYFTNTEPLFDTTNLIAKVNPSAIHFDIPVNLTLSPGLHYIWLSATLKDNVNINDKIELHCTGLTDATNRTVAIAEENAGYNKRMGIALRKAGDDGVNTYRIPGITATDRGTLLAVYDIRYNNSKDLPENIDVGMNRSTDGGQTWEPMKVMMDMGAPHENNGIGDPAILFDPFTKKIWVAALWSKGNHSIAGSIGGLSPDSTGQFMLASSDDDGITWSKPVNITAQVKDPAWKIFFQGPGNGIAMQNGTIVFPAQYWDENKMPHSTIIYSNDHGATWNSGTGAKSNTTESTVVETTPGTLMLNMRDNRGEFRSIATTKNMGKDWIEDPTSYRALVDPVCMGSLLKARVKVKGIMKDVLFFSNPNSSSVRSHITIKASLDQGKTWIPANQLLIDERKCYGYSSLTKIDDNTIGILYEGVKDLYFIRVPVSDIIK